MSSRSHGRSGRTTPKGTRPPGTSASGRPGASASSGHRPVVDRRHELHGRPAPRRAVVPRPGRGGDR